LSTLKKIDNLDVDSKILKNGRKNFQKQVPQNETQKNIL